MLVDQPELLLRIPSDGLQETVASIVHACRRRLPMAARRIERDAILADEDRRAFVEALELEILGSERSADASADHDA